VEPRQRTNCGSGKADGSNDSADYQVPVMFYSQNCKTN